MAAPLLIPQSRDPLDTRPDTSGYIPPVHYNVPMYQRLPTQASDPGTTIMSPLARVIAGVIGGGAHDLRTNYDPTTVAGAVNLASNFFPGNLHSGLVPKEFPSSVPGIKISRVIRGDHTLDWRGDPARIPYPNPGDARGSAVLGYNAVDAQGKIVGSISGVLDSTGTYIDSMYVNPAYRNTGLFRDLVTPAMQRGLPISGSVVNKRLGAVVERLKSRYPLLSAVQTRSALGFDPEQTERWSDFVHRMTSGS